MNIDINLLPEDLRPQPPIRARTLVMLVLIVALAGSGYFLFDMMSNAKAETTVSEERIADFENTIDQIESELNSTSGNPQATALSAEVASKRTSRDHQSAFASSRIRWGSALESVYNYVPKGVALNSLTQAGNNLIVKGTASEFDDVTPFSQALDRDVKFRAPVGVSYESPDFSLNLTVETGVSE